MADTKLSGLTELSTPVSQEDEIYIRDASEGTAADQAKRILVDTFFSRVLCYDGDPLTYDDDFLIF